MDAELIAAGGFVGVPDPELPPISQRGVLRIHGYGFILGESDATLTDTGKAVAAILQGTPT